MIKRAFSCALAVLAAAACGGAEIEDTRASEEGGAAGEIVERVDTRAVAAASGLSPRSAQEPVAETPIVAETIAEASTVEAAQLAGLSAGKCDPNYSGCVPIARDVDCEGGGGDGPAYVRGPVRVLRRDIYRLDRDRDGTGCED